MKKYLSVLIVAFFVLFCGLANAGWHSDTQATRNQRIVNQANHDLTLNGYPGCPTCFTVGGACKVWAVDVVRVASNLAGGPNVPVWLPATDQGGNGYAWVPDSNVTSYGALAPNSMQPGMIIQMRLRYVNGTYGPHTAIVFSTSVATQKVTLVESNYNGDYKVKTRTVSYSWFGSPYIESGNHYTVYQIR